MLQKNEKIGGWQLICLLAASQQFWLIGWPHKLKNGLLLAATLLVVTALMAVYLLAAPGFDAQRFLKSRWAKTLLWLFCTFMAMKTAYEFLTEFSILFERQFQPLLVLLALLLSAAAIMGMGWQALCRAGFILLPIILLSYLLLLVGAADQCSLLNLTPPEQNVGEFLPTVGAAFSHQAELILFLFLRPRAVNPPKKQALSWLLIGLVGEEFLVILSSLTMGAYGSLSVYPFYAFSRVADLSSASRLTPVYWLLLIVFLLLRLGAFALMSIDAFPFGKKSMKRSGVLWIQIIIFLAGILAIYYLRVSAGWLAGISLGGLLLFFLLQLFIRNRRRRAA